MYQLFLSLLACELVARHWFGPSLAQSAQSNLPVHKMLRVTSQCTKRDAAKCHLTKSPRLVLFVLSAYSTHAVGWHLRSRNPLLRVSRGHEVESYKIRVEISNRIFLIGSVAHVTCRYCGKSHESNDRHSNMRKHKRRLEMIR